MSEEPRGRFGPADWKPRIRSNERIRVPQVRVIDAEGQQVGIMDTRDALALAREKGLDLVEISPTARPPVCRVMDFGKYKYEEAKKQRAAKKKQHSIQVKEVKLRPKIDDHDFNFKVAAARKFLEQHHKVKLTIMYRGREMAHPELGERLLQRVIRELSEIGTLEQTARLEGRNLTTMMGPRPAKGGSRPRPKSDEAPAVEEIAGSDGPHPASMSGEAPPAGEGRPPEPAQT